MNEVSFNWCLLCRRTRIVQFQSIKAKIVKDAWDSQVDLRCRIHSQIDALIVEASVIHARESVRDGRQRAAETLELSDGIFPSQGNASQNSYVSFELRASVVSQQMARRFLQARMIGRCESPHGVRSLRHAYTLPSLSCSPHLDPPPAGPSGIQSFPPRFHHIQCRLSIPVTNVHAVWHMYDGVTSVKILVTWFQSIQFDLFHN